MGSKNQPAKSLFQEYRRLTEIEADQYNRLKTMFPTHDFPKQAARVWRMGMLAEIWGTVATSLTGGTTNYLSDWGEGR